MDGCNKMGNGNLIVGTNVSVPPSGQRAVQVATREVKLELAIVSITQFS
jgi:hypothetical protein